MRVVLDTSVMVAAIRSDAGASRRLLTAVLERRLIMIASVPLMVEYEAVMTRQQHLKASALSRDDVGALLDAVAAVAEPAVLAFRWRPVSPDPDDDIVVETAVNGRAHTIVTFNLRDLSTAAASFGIDVLLPGEAWKRWMAAP
ncbi:MAG: putative toxin-antitoxin system toxin component, PIN family [Janthinobacterium lividum]